MTASATDFTAPLANGIAQLLSDSGVAVWRDAQDYTAGETGIYLVRLPDNIATTDPDRALAVNIYDLTDDPTFQESEKGIQVWARGARNSIYDLWTLSDRLDNALLGLWPTTLTTGVRVVTLTKTSASTPAQDDAKRWLRVSNYTALTHRPSAHRQ